MGDPGQSPAGQWAAVRGGSCSLRPWSATPGMLSAAQRRKGCAVGQTQGVRLPTCTQWLSRALYGQWQDSRGRCCRAGTKGGDWAGQSKSRQEQTGHGHILSDMVIDGQTRYHTDTASHNHSHKSHTVLHAHAVTDHHRSRCTMGYLVRGCPQRPPASTPGHPAWGSKPREVVQPSSTSRLPHST